MPIARIEPLAGVIRYWDNDDTQHGDPYSWVATVRWIDPETIEILGITQPPTPNIWRAVKESAAKTGVKTILFSRYRNGIKKVKTVKVDSSCCDRLDNHSNRDRPK